MDIKELYQEIVLDHGKNPRNKNKCKGFNKEAKGYNPLCGDKVHVFLKLDNDKKVEDISFEGEGCAISIASASIMTETIKGKEFNVAKKILEHFLKTFGYKFKDFLNNDMPIGKKGVIPDSEFYDEWYPDFRWGALTTLSNSIGQGEILVTPIQLANMMASVANKGYLEAVTWSFTDSKIDKQFSQGKKEIQITNPISKDLDVLRRSIFSNLMICLKKNQDRGYLDLSLFEIGPTFSGNKPGEQQVVLGGLKSGVENRKTWSFYG